MSEREINGLKIVFGEGEPSKADLAFGESVARVYKEKLANIAEHLANDEGMKDCFGTLSKEEIIAGLNDPIVRVTGDGDGLLTYCNHVFDDTHIIDLEFDGALESFCDVTVDG